jgi:hypothetical protein
MSTRKHPRDLADLDADAIVAAFDRSSDESKTVVDAALLSEIRDAASAQRNAERRIEAAAVAAHRAGLSWGIIGAQLGMTRQGARQRFGRLTKN